MPLWPSPDGDLSCGGDRTGVSTTALSHIIAKFEAEMGVRLFNRTTRSVGLTDAGRLFIDNIGPSLQGVHQALEVVRSRSETPSGVLRINTPPFAARALLSRVVLEFCAAIRKCRWISSPMAG